MRAFSIRSWTLTGSLALLVAVSTASAVSMLASQRPLRGAGGCAFPDGLGYCRIARGLAGAQPFNQRPLVPLAARATRAITDVTLVSSFRIVAVVGLLLTLGALAALGYVISLGAGASRRDAVEIAVAAPALWFVTPFALRFALTAPVLTDELATGLAIAWLALLFAPWRSRGMWMLAPVVAVLATLSRETAFVTIAATCVVAGALGVIARRDAYLSAGASALAAIFDVTRPYKASNYDALSSWAKWLGRWFDAPRASIVALLMGVSFAVVALLPGVLSRAMRAVPRPRVVGALLPAAVVPLLLATFGGVDVARLSSAATPVLSLLLACYLVLAAKTEQILIVAVGAAIFIRGWHPFGLVARSQAGYVAYFFGRTSFGTWTLVALAVVAVALIVSNRRLRPVE
jgi:hypothetical protein